MFSHHCTYYPSIEFVFAQHGYSIPEVICLLPQIQYQCWHYPCSQPQSSYIYEHDDHIMVHSPAEIQSPALTYLCWHSEDYGHTLWGFHWVWRTLWWSTWQHPWSVFTCKEYPFDSCHCTSPLLSLPLILTPELAELGINCVMQNSSLIIVSITSVKIPSFHSFPLKWTLSL